VLNKLAIDPSGERPGRADGLDIAARATSRSGPTTIKSKTTLCSSTIPNAGNVKITTGGDDVVTIFDSSSPKIWDTAAATSSTRQRRGGQHEPRWRRRPRFRQSGRRAGGSKLAIGSGNGDDGEMEEVEAKSPSTFGRDRAIFADLIAVAAASP
jgi:hypothetical protein